MITTALVTASLVALVASIWVMSVTYRKVILATFAVAICGSVLLVVGRGKLDPITSYRTLYSLWMAAIAVFVLALGSGILRRCSADESIYRTRRSVVYRFLAKWAAIYAVYYLIVSWVVLQGLAGADGNVAWMFMRQHGWKGFAAGLSIYIGFLAANWFRVKRRAQASQAVQLNANAHSFHAD